MTIRRQSMRTSEIAIIIFAVVVASEDTFMTFMTIKLCVPKEIFLLTFAALIIALLPIFKSFPIFFPPFTIKITMRKKDVNDE